jgi:hypothetical protein
MLNLAFYTCFYGSNENIAFKIPPLPSLKYKCYYYTNNTKIFKELQDSRWIRIYDEKPVSDNLVESAMLSKHVKAKPHEYIELKEYDYLCYLDSKLKKVNEAFIEGYIQRSFIEKNYALILRKHSALSNNVWSEYNEAMKHERYKIHSDNYERYIHDQIKNGLSETTTQDHCMTGLLIRNMKHSHIQDINNTWYQHIQDCGIECQIAFFFVKQLFPDDIFSFSEFPFI